MRSFRETVTQSLAAWLDFYARSWELAGSPPGLSPDLLIHDPIQHNATTYRWIEQRHGLDTSREHYTPVDVYWREEQSIDFREVKQLAQRELERRGTP